jgi:hypothetical protein
MQAGGYPAARFFNSERGYQGGLLTMVRVRLAENSLAQDGSAPEFCIDAVSLPKRLLQACDSHIL